MAYEPQRKSSITTQGHGLYPSDICALPPQYTVGVRTNLLEFPFDSTCNTCSTPASWQFVRSVAGRLGKGASLTPRELSVLRSLSLGHRIAEISNDLGLGEETVRSHVKKAQAKLGVRNSVHAVAQAVRLRLIP